MDPQYECDAPGDTAVVQFDDRLPVIDPQKAAAATRILSDFVGRLLEEFRDELHEGVSHRRVMDFEMVGDVLEERVYGKIVGASLRVAEKLGQRKVILTQGTRKDIEEYLKNAVRSVLKGARTLQATLAREDLVVLGGVLKDAKWRGVKGYLSRLGEQRREFRVLAHILANCCMPFEELGIGDESCFLDRKTKAKYEHLLRNWGESHAVPKPRTDTANDADASTLATLDAVTGRPPGKLKLHLVTATRALSDVCAEERRVSLQNPIHFYLSQKVREFYGTALGCLDFCRQCAREILQLERGFDLVRYGADGRQSVRRSHVQELLGAWEGILRKGALSEIRGWFETAASYSIDKWVTSPLEVQETVDCCVPWVEIGHVISEARQLLKRLLRDDEDMLSLIGGRWLDPVDLPGGRRHTLLLDVPHCEVSVEAFRGHYSLYWDADCTLGIFLEVIAELRQANQFKPVQVSLICSNGEEMDVQSPSVLSVAFVRKALAGKMLSMIMVESAEVDICYEFCSVAANIDPVVATNILDRIRRARVAVVSCSRMNGLAGKLCQRTAGAFIAEADFAHLFADKLNMVFD